jgi:hypothetical protein
MIAATAVRTFMDTLHFCSPIVSNSETTVTVIRKQKDPKAQRHKETPHQSVLFAAFLCAFVPLCLGVSWPT